MKIAEIRELTTADLKERVETEKVKLHQMMLNHAISHLEDPSQIKKLRKTIARMLTILRERELNN